MLFYSSRSIDENGYREDSPDVRAAIVQLRAGHSGRQLAKSILARVNPPGRLYRPNSAHDLPPWGLAHRLAAGHEPDVLDSSSDEVPVHDNDSSNVSD